MKPLITKLTTWKKTDEDEEFVDKAIDSLYKKLKTKNGAIEDLQYAINNPSMPSKCVTIPRSLDGRLQVSHRKGLPHVIYCRIFRWPDLQTPHELRGIDSCEFTFAAKQTEVCVNPYHYERVDIPILPPVLVPKCVEFAPAHSIVHQHTPTITNGENQSYRPVLPSQSAILSYSSYYQYNNNHHNTSYFNNSPMTSTSSSATGSPQNYMEESSISSSHADSFSSNYSPSNNNHNTNNNSNNANTNTNCTHGNIDTIDNISQLIHYQEPTNWCSIFYYELNSRIGEAFYAAYNNVFVDGYTNPCNNYGRRFCLGMFSNVNRNLTTENCRRHIGRGIHLYNDGGDIYVENLSECSVFIQSRNSNQGHGFHPFTVCKLPSAYNLRIFQSKLFADMLKEAIDQGYDSVYELSHHCLIKLSFVKGWGADYYRQDVSSCPCWIEIRLNGPFQWLDKVLKHMGSPNNPVSSVS